MRNMTGARAMAGKSTGDLMRDVLHNSFIFEEAKREACKLRLAIAGFSGTGKTRAALEIATGIGGKIAVIDCECRSASLYADKYKFSTTQLSAPYSPERYIAAINAAEEAGYDIIIVDGISPEWDGEGGIIESKDKMGGGFNDWAKLTPRHNKFKNAILWSPVHIICTMSAKAEYVVEPNSKGRSVPRQVGMAPIQRSGFARDFTVVMELDQQHQAVSTKDRTRLFDGQTFQIDSAVGVALRDWLDAGAVAKTISVEQEQEIVSAMAAKGYDVNELDIQGLFFVPNLLCLRVSDYPLALKAVVEVWPIKGGAQQSQGTTSQTISKHQAGQIVRAAEAKGYDVASMPREEKVRLFHVEKIGHLLADDFEAALNGIESWQPAPPAQQTH